MGVFGLMGRGAHYDDNLATPLAMPPDTANFGKPLFVAAPLKRCSSQPVIKQPPSTQQKPDMTKDDMRLATGAVTATKPDGQGFLPSANSDYNSVALRYDTHPQYSSNIILSTFQNEFQSFGQRSQAGEHRPSTHDQLAVPSQQLQSQTSNFNANASSPSKTFTVIKQRSFNALISSAASHKLAGLSEEKGEEEGDISGKEVVERDGGQLERLQTGNKMSSLTNMPLSTNPIDASAARMEKLPITKQVIGWLHGPNNKVKASRVEMNAFSPSSF